MVDEGPGQIVQIADLSADVQQLINEANEARKFAYCPYSNFAVGAALRTQENVIIRGCNVESCVFSPSVCAERTAVCKAVSEGIRKFTSIAIVAFEEDNFTSPCGVCRQVLYEFSGDELLVYLSKPDGKQALIVKLKELLPLAFVLNKKA